jgi:O-antigen/teichoic acid export membrane protein
LNRLKSNISWTFASFVILASCGILINLVITFTRDTAALGLFNLAYSIYMIVSQIAVWGIHYSVLRYSSVLAPEFNRSKSMLATGLVMSLVLGAVAALALYLAAPLFSLIFSSDGLKLAVQYSAIGILLFPANKVLLAGLNGTHQMRWYALLQSLRYILVFSAVAAISFSSAAASLLTIAFSVAEGITFVCALYVVVKLRLLRWMPSFRWARRHFSFGTRGLAGGIMVEINARIDIFLIGALLNERAVGIYSFAAMLVDGTQHLLTVIRTNYNPLIAQYVFKRDYESIRQLYRRGSVKIMLAMLLFMGLLLTAYWIFVYLIAPEKGMQQSWLVLAILLGALWLVCSIVPFDNMLLVGGFPNWQALQYFLIALANVAVCVVLIPSLGILGAAFGTGAGYLVGAFAVVFMSKRLIGVKLP